MAEVKRLRRGLAGLCTAGALVVLTACSGSSTPGTGGSSTAASSLTDATNVKRGGTLTIAESSPFPMDPAMASPPFVLAAAYDSLIHLNVDNTYSPDLATSWSMRDGSRLFKLKLRKGVKFSDGTAMTADTVAASLKRIVKTPGPNGSIGPVKSVTAVGDDEVDVAYSKAVPESFAVNTFSQADNFGIIVGPTGTAKPSTLSKASDGVGPYKLDPSQSNSSKTTFIPNANYFNQKAIKFDKVVVTQIPDATARLNALRSGQVDYVFDDGTANAASAQSAGLQISQHGSLLPSLVLENRTSGPLAKLEVRQAIEYAVDRSAMIKSLFSGIGTAQSSVGIKGLGGYDKKNSDPYPYNVAKAKALLKKAGYPDGLTISTLDFSQQDANGSLAQAFASQLKAVGITLKIHVISTGFTQFLTAISSKKYDAVVTNLPGNDIYTEYNQFLGKGTVGNGFGVVDSTVDQLMTAAGTASASEEDTAMQAITNRIDQQAWIVSVGVIPTIDLAAKNLVNIAPDGSPNSQPYAFDPTAKSSWYLK